ncbi:MAG: ABC transporter ATP-binding protein [Spirochaetales bacterium]|nr:ABC transporter ATP-binding protein [Spirochaetales bacterium]
MIIENLCFSYGKKVVFSNLNIQSDSKIICLMGKSGCGKTTLLHLIAGLLKQDSGNITGIDMPCSLMFQEDRLLPWLNAKENVALVLENKDDKKASDILRSLGIEPDMELSKMSGGMKRRVTLARALAFESKTLLLDEPFKGLDENLTNSCAQLIKKEGKLTIVSTHSQKEAEALDATIIRIDDPDKIGIKN